MLWIYEFSIAGHMLISYCYYSYCVLPCVLLPHPTPPSSPDLHPATCYTLSASQLLSPLPLTHLIFITSSALSQSFIHFLFVKNVRLWIFAFSHFAFLILHVICSYRCLWFGLSVGFDLAAFQTCKPVNEFRFVLIINCFYPTCAPLCLHLGPPPVCPIFNSIFQLNS